MCSFAKRLEKKMQSIIVFPCSTFHQMSLLLTARPTNAPGNRYKANHIIQLDLLLVLYHVYI
jgi:hypothetical protein